MAKRNSLMKVPKSKEMFQERDEANETTNPIPQEVGRTDRAIWFYYISNFYSNFSLWVKPSPFTYDSPSFNSLSPRPLLEFFFAVLRYWNRFEPSWYFLFQFSDYLPPEYFSIFISVGSLKKKIDWDITAIFSWLHLPHLSCPCSSINI